MSATRAPAPRGAPPRPAPGRLAGPLIGALLCALAFALTAALALGVTAVHVRDAALFHAFWAMGAPLPSDAARLVIKLGDPVPYAAAGLVLVVIAVQRGRTARAVAVAALLMMAGAATQVAKVALATTRFDAWLEQTDGQIGPVAFPSGHATAAMTLALCAVLVAPAAWRTATALAGWAFATAMGFALVDATWHYPSDVIGGYLVAGLGAALALAAIRAIEASPAAERRSPPRGAALLAVAAGAVSISVALLVVHGDAVTLYPYERATLALGALLMTALTGALSFAFARAA